MTLKKGDKVTLIKLPKRIIKRLKLGMQGRVVATRPRIDNHLLIKFKGKSGLVSIDPDEVKNFLKEGGEISGNFCG